MGVIEGLSKRYDETDFLEDNYPDAIEYNGFDRIGTELIRKRPLDKVGLGLIRKRTMETIKRPFDKV
jgi:hypothetical protein